jgi:hypothetical protein
MTVPRAFDGNIDGEPLPGDHDMDRQQLLHAASLVTYGWEPMSISLDSIVNIRSQFHADGAGRVTVREALEWVRTNGGKEALSQEPPNILQYLERMAADLIG